MATGGRIFSDTEHGVARDSAAGRREFARQMERRQRAEDKADYEGVRRGWFLGERSVYLWKEMDRIHKMNRIPIEQNEIGCFRGGEIYRLTKEQIENARR